MPYLGFGKPFEEQPYKGFFDPLNSVAITTSFVTEENKDITYITYNKEDNAWLFFSNDEYNDFEKVMRVVKFSDIILLDSSILEIQEIPEGYYATRNNKTENWKIKKL